ncbi:MAG: hypothetical protein V4648_07270 [Bacteroidota bacterium]
MKKQLLLYLFIVAVLMNVFTYMYFSKKEVSDKKSVETSVKRLKDSITTMSDELYDANYFSLEHNDNAQNYLETIDYLELMPLVKNELLNYNDSPEGNKYVDQPMMGEQKFIINKIKILNARWIIADFNNGQIWGEVLLKYFVKEDKTISFETIQTFIYPPQ